MNGREFLDEYEGRNRDTNEIVSMAKVNIRLEVKSKHGSLV
mgnify:CR=1 FL=1